MVAQSPEPGAHVLNARAFRIELEFRNVGFCGEGKTGVPGEKPLVAETRTNNKLEGGQTGYTHLFSAENFREQDKYVQFYTLAGIISWNVFLHLFTFITDECKDMKCWRSAVKVIVNHQHELRQGRPLGLSVLDEFLLTIVRLRCAFAVEQLSVLD